MFARNKSMLRRSCLPILALFSLGAASAPREEEVSIPGRDGRRLAGTLNHHFNVDPVGATDGYDRLPTQALAPAFLETLSAWLARTLQVRPGAPGARDR